MDDYKTIRVSAEAWEVANDAKHDGETWGEYVRRCAEERRVLMSEQQVRNIVRDELASGTFEEIVRRKR